MKSGSKESLLIKFANVFFVKIPQKLSTDNEVVAWFCHKTIIKKCQATDWVYANNVYVMY